MLACKVFILALLLGSGLFLGEQLTRGSASAQAPIEGQAGQAAALPSGTASPAQAISPAGSAGSGQAYTETQYSPAVLPQGVLPALDETLAGAARRGVDAFAAHSAAEPGARPELTLRSSHFDGRVLTLDFSAAGPLDEREWGELLHAVDLEVGATLYRATGSQGLSIEYRILLDGTPLERTLPPVEADPGAPRLPSAPQATGGIQGQRIAINPGHGYYMTSDGAWHLQRNYFYGIVEDFVNLELAADLDRLVRASGGDARPVRQVNKNAGYHPSAYPWWQMGASEYVRSLGAPGSVWLPLPYSNGYSHDIAARPEYANWIGAGSMVSIHNNGAGSAACNNHGTETWYDTSNGYQAQSVALAQAIHGKLVQRIRERWDAGWCDRGVKGSNGGYGEIRRFRGPGVLVELAYMDVQSDNAALQDPTFRAIAMAAVNEALMQYHGPVSCPAITGWRGEYWNNRFLSGSAVMCRNEDDVNFSWGTGGPGGSVLNDHFSARWTRDLNLGAGSYRFHLRADDGMRLWIDDNLVIDRWLDQPPTEYTVDRTLGAGSHNFKIEYYEKDGGAAAQFWYETIGCTAGQYRAEYYDNRTLSGSPAFTRCEDQLIDWEWGNGGPGNGIGSDNFSVRWRGEVNMAAGPYTFIARTDDGMRVWFDGILMLDSWIVQAPTEYRVSRMVSAGAHTLLVEYYESEEGAVAQFRWEQAPNSNYTLYLPVSIR